MSQFKHMVKFSLLLAILSVQLGNVKTIYAQEFLPKIVQETNEISEGQLNYLTEGQMFFDSYNYDVALAFWLRALKVAPIDSRVYYWVGHAYHHGFGTEQDDALAFQYYSLAFEHGDENVFNFDLWSYFFIKHEDFVNASTYLALLYLWQETDEGYRQAAEYLKISATQTEYIPAYYQLGIFYYYGIGVEKNIKTAEGYFNIVNKAEQQYYIQAKLILARIHRNGENGVVNKKLAYELTLQLADSKHPEGLYYLAGEYYNGGLLEQDYQQAFKFFKMSAEKDYAAAHYFVGKMYLNGEGVEIDYRKALFWYQQSASYGHARSYLPLARLYQGGFGISEDPEKARYYLTLAGKAGDVEADFQLGMTHYFGSSVKPNAKLASEYFTRAAYQGHVLAQYNLAILYRHGIGVKQNYPLALIWYKIAAKAGNEEALEGAEEIMGRLNAEEQQYASHQVDKWLANKVANVN